MRLRTWQPAVVFAEIAQCKPQQLASNCTGCFFAFLNRIIMLQKDVRVRVRF